MQRPRWIRRYWLPLLAVYLTLVLVTHLAPLGHTPTARFPTLDMPAFDDAGPVPGQRVTGSYLHWAADGPDVLLVHGSPGDASNFAKLGPLLAEQGFDTYAIDLPGFGNSSHWVPRYSIRAHAHALREYCRQLELERPHLVGWSMGGGVILHAGDDHPEEYASLTLLGAIGAQETEGSGDYYFEHFKYGLGYLVFVIGGELVPIPWHQQRHFRHSWIRNFWDTDQRPLRGIMERLHLPVLVLHGRHDPLVSEWAARRHAELLRNARLVMLDASHFLPFNPVETTADYLARFFRDPAGVADYEEVSPGPGYRAAVQRYIGARWWLWQAIGLASVTMLAWWLGVALGGGLVAGLYLDPLVAAVGLTIGRWARSERRVWTLLPLLVSSTLLVFAASLLSGAIGWALVIVLFGVYAWYVARSERHPRQPEEPLESAHD